MIRADDSYGFEDEIRLYHRYKKTCSPCDPKIAIRHLTSALESDLSQVRDENVASAYSYRSTEYRELKDFAAAERDARKAGRLAPHHGAVVTRGRALRGSRALGQLRRAAAASVASVTLPATGKIAGTIEDFRAVGWEIDEPPGFGRVVDGIAGGYRSRWRWKPPSPGQHASIDIFVQTADNGCGEEEVATRCKNNGGGVLLGSIQAGRRFGLGNWRSSCNKREYRYVAEEFSQEYAAGRCLMVYLVHQGEQAKDVGLKALEAMVGSLRPLQARPPQLAVTAEADRSQELAQLRASRKTLETQCTKQGMIDSCRQRGWLDDRIKKLEAAHDGPQEAPLTRSANLDAVPMDSRIHAASISEEENRRKLLAQRAAEREQENDLMFKVIGIAIFLLLLAFAAIRLSKRKGMRAEPPPAPALLAPQAPASLTLPTPTALAGAVSDKRAALDFARSYVKARKTRDFLGAQVDKTAAFSVAYARAFLLAGDYELPYELLNRSHAIAGWEGKAFHTLRAVVGRRRAGGLFSESQAYSERLELAQGFSAAGLHDEAVGMLTEDVVKYAGRDENDAYMVAQVYDAADRGTRFIDEVAAGRPAGFHDERDPWDRERDVQRPPEFYSTFAGVFRILDRLKEALALLQKKPALVSGDYDLFLELHAGLGSLESLDSADIPAEHRGVLAQGLFDAGAHQKAWGVLEATPRAIWSAREYGLALRLCQRLARSAQAEALYQEAAARLPVERAPELRYYFALVIEKRGQFERAKGIYRELLSKLGDYKDAEARLRNLEAVPAEETSQLSSVLTAADIRQTTTGVAGAAAPPTAMPPLVAGRFEILLPAGIGGMGIVYKAYDRKLQRPVAVKRMRAELTKETQWRARFLEEARLQSGLQHPGIVGLYDVVDDGGTVHLVFEFVDGETFGEVLAARGRLSGREAAELVRPVCSALGYAHGRGVAHLDVKPSNIMRERSGAVKVLDFGLARQLAGGGGGGGAGTPAYMAPEQHGGAVSAACDIFAVGAMLYELLMGRLPFPGPDVIAQKRRGLYAALPEGVPERLRNLVAACLQPDPKLRPQGMGEVLAGLDAARETRAAV